MMMIGMVESDSIMPDEWPRRLLISLAINKFISHLHRPISHFSHVIEIFRFFIQLLFLQENYFTLCVTGSRINMFLFADQLGYDDPMKDRIA